MYTLCAKCISEDVSVVFPFTMTFFGGAFSGDEKMPSKSSIPCSSRAFWGNVMPVFLAIS